MQNQKRPSTIDDAIKILDDVLVKQQMPDLSPLLGDEFNSVKQMIGEKTVAEAKGFQKTAEEFGATVATFTGVGLEQAQLAAQEGLAQAKKLGAQIDAKVRENPWPVLGGIALGSLAFGILLARAVNAPQTSEGATPPIKES
jgi:ElaB/YqjD/DUF883 family membrane-anchored ribosome-binding protein